MPENSHESTPESCLAWLRLSQLHGVGPVLVRRVVEALGSPQAVLAASPARLADVPDIGPVRAKAFASAMSLEDAQRELSLAHDSGVHILCPDDPRWPKPLKFIHDPPLILYVRGQLIEQDAVALGIVGSRECTMYGRQQAERFGALLASAGFTVVSGGARGIDTAAHHGALRAKGRTIIVQGCGLNHTYPSENAELYDRVAREGSGAVISELPMNAPPHKDNFPPRNRIIAALSLGVLVVEAHQRSGSLITARLAADDYGREVFALPGRVDSLASRGTHHLIKNMTAHLVEDIDDILNALGDVGEAIKKTQQAKAEESKAAALFDQKPDPTPAIVFTGPQQKILAALGDDDVDIDSLIEHTGLGVGVLMAELTALQIRGAVAKLPGNRFTKKKRG